MEKVVSVKPVEGKTVEVVFSDGVCGVFDVTPYIKSDFLGALKTINISGKLVGASVGRRGKT